MKHVTGKTQNTVTYKTKNARLLRTYENISNEKSARRDANNARWL